MAWAIKLQKRCKKWHLNPLNGLSSGTNVTDRRTDHAMEKCVAISGIACTAAAIPPNNINNTPTLTAALDTLVMTRPNYYYYYYYYYYHYHY